MRDKSMVYKSHRFYPTDAAIRRMYIETAIARSKSLTVKWTRKGVFE